MDFICTTAPVQCVRGCRVVQQCGFPVNTIKMTRKGRVGARRALRLAAARAARCRGTERAAARALAPRQSAHRPGGRHTTGICASDQRRREPK
ncbi:hypothetical protein B5X24_HaOG215170 [Helicoverpa armigera]|nr:hypothetical protein B5X24_HaOG215170 [Helicoverpa armigera]